MTISNDAAIEAAALGANATRATLREDVDPAWSARVKARLQNLTLAQLLRGVGSLIIVSSALAFMVQSWSGGDVLSRYLHFLAFTGVLCGAGFYCGLRQRDNAGARTFLALAAAAVPAHFIVLAAILVPQFSRFVDLRNPVFDAPDPAAANLTAGLGIALISGITWLAFRVLARSQAKVATWAYLGFNAVLLLPVRDADAVALIGAGCVAALAVFDRRVLQPTAAMRTLEGYLVRIMLAAPVVLLFARTLFFYSGSDLLTTVGLGGATLVLFGLATRCHGKLPLALSLELASLFSSMGFIAMCMDVLSRFVRIPDSLGIPIFVLPLSGLLFAVSKYGALDTQTYRRWAVLLPGMAMIFSVGMFSTLTSAILCLAVSLVAIAFGFKEKEKLPFAVGVLGLGWSLLHSIGMALHLYTLGVWGSLALVGVAAVLAASFYEKHQAKLLVRASELKEHFA